MDQFGGSLSENIRLLGNLLGETIIEQSGQDVFELEERIRSLSKAWRGGDESAEGKIRETIAALSTNLPLTADILNAFATYFGLVNLAEEHQRINVLRERTERAFQSDVTMDESICAAIEDLQRQGFNSAQVESMFDQMKVTPVFTAHPTESKRRTTRQTLSYLSDQLFQLRSCATLEHQHSKLIDNIRAAITLLWQSDENRKRKPTVMDEVRNTGLYFFEHTLFEQVPRIYEAIESALAKYYPEHDWSVPTVLQFGSWIGGDRDGNPFVTNETTERAIQAQIELALERYAADVHELYELLSPSLSRANFDRSFLRRLDEELQQIPASESATLDRFSQEPYRQKLILIYRRIAATITLSRQRWRDREPCERAYPTAAALLSDLRQIEQSLVNNKGHSLARGQLSQLIRRVQVFGFHLASLDIRQHSGRHELAVDEILAHCEITSQYGKLPEAQRRELLSHEIENPRPLTAQLDFSDSTNDTVSLFRLIHSAHQHAGPQCIQSYVVSMTESVSDILEVLLLMSDAGLFGKLDLVPLFETVGDLRAASEIMSKLFSDPVYRKHLSLREDRQQIMIGYSDSNKDGGYLRANWMLFVAQRNLAKVCQQHDIQLTLFHGRGGSIGRGGGPANRSILAQPPESICGRIRITEQGEVVSSRYTHSEIAFRHLQQLLNAVIGSLGRRPQYAKYASWSEIIEALSAEAFRKYRSLVERPDFIDYFQSATPIGQIDQLNLGSRPARRKTTKDIGDLRAIPWVFAWTQSRANIPSWFGVGTALEKWIDQNGATAEQQLDELRSMYDQWPFFQSVLCNVHVGMGKADMNIASLYSELASDDDGKSLFLEIVQEYQLTRQRLLTVTGHDQILDTEPWLQHSIRMRNPYVDPMNYIQVALLDRLQQVDNESDATQIQHVIVQSINGIASGLQSVG